MKARTKMPTGIHLRTHAKVNLFLRILGKRPDGYHEIETILHGIRLADDIEVLPTESGLVEVETKLAEDAVGTLPALEDNLVWHASQSLIQKGALNSGVLIRLTKRIPIGAGLGGGSGNAAGALVALNEIWDLKLTSKAISDTASQLGSDVPYCLGGGTTLATARGEKLTPLPTTTAMWFVLGITDRPLLTRDVYATFDDLGHPEESSSVPMTLALGAGDVGEVATLLHNDLERATFKLMPELEEKKFALRDAGARGAGLSGSGPTIFGIASGEDHAQSVASAVRSLFDRVLVVTSQPTCIERLD